MSFPNPEPLAIIGIGALFPKADSLEAYWANVKGAVDCIGEVPPTHWDPKEHFDPDPKARDKVHAKRGGFLDPFDFDPLEFGISPQSLEATDTAQLLGLVAAKRALEDAGYGEGSGVDRDRISCILGVTGTLELVIPLGARLGHPLWRRALRESGVDQETADEVVERIAEGYVPWQEASFPGLLGNVVAGRIANRLDLGGTNCVVDAACASSLSALHLAAMELQSGRADLVVTGGVDTFNDVFMYSCFSKTPALSPTGDARPFDAAADGTILGEGLGIVVLKRLSEAERDGDRVHAVLKGIGSSSDGRGTAIYAPTVKGQVKALRRAYEQAGVCPSTVELVEAHGTGTKVGDATEAKALCEVYTEARSEGTWCALGSVKSQIGHTKAAAGAASLVKAAMALHAKVLPPTIKVEQPNDVLAPGTTPFYVNTQKRPWVRRAAHPRRAALSALGFGGSNFHCVLEEHEPFKREPDWDGDVQLIALSGADAKALASQLESLRELEVLRDLESPRQLDWKALRLRAAATRAAFDGRAPARLLLVVEKGRSELEELLSSTKTRLAEDAAGPWTTPQGASFATGPAPGRLALLFPGQGAQAPGMMRDLACLFPEMLEALEQADASSGLPGLSDLIYPHPAFDEATRQRQAKALTATEVAQPALGAVELGGLAVLRRFGVEAEVAAGHSYGELVALHAAGCFDAAALFELSRHRGELMAGDGGDRGSMLAVRAPVQRVEQAIAEAGLDLVVANRNAPEQCVLSGSTEEIARAEVVLKQAGLTAMRLDVAAAFHSELVADAAAPFASALEGIDWSDPRLEVFSNSEAAPYPVEPAKARELLARQLARPVEFHRQVEAMYEAGCRSFLELGPGARLSGLVRAILGTREHHAISLDASGGRGDGVADLARALARLAALGHAVDLRAWDAGWAEREASRPAREKAMSVMLTGANFVSERPARPARAARPVPAQAAEAPQAVTPPPPQAVVPPGQEPTPQPQAVTPPPPKAPTPQPQTPLAAPQQPAGPALQEPVLAELLRVSQQQVAALQQMAQQTADVHRRFLESQDASQAAFAAVLEHQQRALGAVAGLPPALAVEEASVPAVAAPIASLPPEAVAPQARRVEHDHETAEPLAAPAAPQEESPSPDEPELEALKVGLLEIVAEKTGYPPEILELDMDLEADLGIDSIKRVEILSAVQERFPEAPAVEAEKLGTLRSLREVLEHLGAASAQSAAPEAEVTAAPAATGGLELEALEKGLLEIVAEKTGYPPEILELDMDLEADLGIDSIKRVEILSAVQERFPEAPAVEAEKLGTLRSLREVLDHLGAAAANVTSTERSAGDAHAPGSATAEQAIAGQATKATAHQATAEQVTEGGADTEANAMSSSDASATQPPPAVPAGTGVERSVPVIAAMHGPRETISLPDNARVWVAGGDDPLPMALVERLQERGLDALRVELSDWKALEIPRVLRGLVLVAPSRGADETFLKDAVFFARACAKALRTVSPSVLATVSRLDGRFGLSSAGPGDEAIAGGLAGLTKTAGLEWEEVRCKALDVAENLSDEEASQAIADELLLSGPAEVGLDADGRWVVGLASAPLGRELRQPLREGDLVVVSGGARGVTADCMVALAEAVKPTLLVLGRSAPPTEEPAWLRALEGEAEIKRALLEHEGPCGPRELGARYATLAGNRQVLRNLERLRDAGAVIRHAQVDVRDEAALETLLRGAVAEAGPVRGLVHGAGVLADQLIEDKTEEAWDRVFGTKVGGLRALLSALDRVQGSPHDLKVLALFSSTTARFGRKGQVDYAVANEVLNKLAGREQRLRPGCRVTSIGWGPWDGGMVTPSLRRVFQTEGVELLAPGVGAAHFVEELCQPPGSPVESVVLGGELVHEPELAGRHEESDGAPLETAFRRRLKIEDHAVLGSHVMKGRAVLPVALMIEWLAHAALHANPGLSLHGLDSLRVLKGVVVDPESPPTLRALAGPPRREGELLAVPVELRGTSPSGGELLHARAEVLLADLLPEAPPVAALPRIEPWQPEGPLYDSVLFHGPDMQGITSVEGLSEEGIIVHARSAPAPADWLERPLRGSWLTDPLAIDCAFQALIIWSTALRGAGSLPVYIGAYRQYQRSFPREGVRLVVRVGKSSPGRALADIDLLDAEGGLVARIEDHECVIDASLAEAFRQNHLAERATS